MPTKPNKVTLKDIADRVGVSISAVSLALKDHPRIAEDTKRRVQLAVDELGYVSNIAGRALRGKQVGAIALIVPNTSSHVLTHSYFLHVLTGINELAAAHDLQVVLSTNADELHGEVAYDRVLRSGLVDGAVVTSAAVGDPGIAQLVRGGMPIVLLGRYPELPEALSVAVDDFGAAIEATEHLAVFHGKRRLAHICGPLGHQSAIDRRDGFLAACERNGIEPVVIEGDYSEQSGAAAGPELLERRIDGVFAANDEMAFGVMGALAAAGCRVPQDVLLVGYDDFGLSRVTSPSISTIHVPAVEMARSAAALLLKPLGITPTTQTPPIPGLTFIPRQSCGC